MIAPMGSNRSPRLTEPSTRAKAMRTTAAIAMGTLMKKVRRQLTSVSTPPSSGPSERKTVAIPVDRPIARPRCSGGYTLTRSAIAGGMRSAAPAP